MLFRPKKRTDLLSGDQVHIKAEREQAQSFVVRGTPLNVTTDQPK